MFRGFLNNVDKNVIYLGLVSFFTDLASSMVTTLLPIFVVFVLKEGVNKLGVVIAVATFVSYAFRVLFGFLSDKFHTVRPFIVIGYMISAISKPLLFFSDTYFPVVILRGIDRLGKAVRSAPKDSLLSVYVKNGQHGKTFGFYKMMDMAGELSGALVIFLIFNITGRNECIIGTIFGWTALPGVIAVLIAIFLLKDIPKSRNVSKSMLNRRDLLLIPLLLTSFGFIFFMLSDQFFVLRARQLGYRLQTIPLFVILFTLTQTISSYYSGVLCDRVGVKKSLLMSFLFGELSVFSLYIDFPWISFIFLGFFTVLAINTIRSYISKYAISKGLIYGIFYSGIAVSASLGALIIGYIWHLLGFGAVVLFSEIGMLLISFALIVLPLEDGSVI